MANFRENFSRPSRSIKIGDFLTGWSSSQLFKKQPVPWNWT